MVTFAQASARRGFGDWCVIATIEGVGDYSGLWKFCSRDVPSYAAGDPSYKAKRMVRWPSTLAEQLDPRGGVAEAGSVTIELLDYGDELTAAFRVNRESATQVSYDAAATGNVFVLNPMPVSTLSVVYIGGEALRVNTKASGELHVTRGWLGTDALPHDAGSPVLLSSPYLKARRIRLYIVPMDADGAGDERLVGTYLLDAVELGDDLNSYVVAGKSAQMHLGRLCMSRPRAYRVTSTTGDAELPTLALARLDLDNRPWLSGEDWPGSETWWRIGDEVLRAAVVSEGGTSAVVTVTARAQVGSKREELSAEGLTAQRVYVADKETGHGSYRYSPGPSASEDRSTGTWSQADDWVSLMLCLMTSSGDPADGLGLVNYQAGGDNFSSLPAGIGAGIPASLIDWTSFLDVRRRTRDWVFPSFALDIKPQPIAKVLEEYFLKPTGAAITIVDGKFRLVLRRLPARGDGATEVEALAERTGRHTYRPLVQAAQDLGLLVSAVVFTMTDPDGAERRVVVTAGDQGTYSPPAHYATDNATLEIDSPGTRMDRGSAFLEQLGLRHLARYGRPMWRVTIEVDLASYAVNVGDYVTVTCAQLPDTTAGTRGWSSVPGQVVGKALHIEGTGIWYTLDILSHGSTMAFGWIPPSAGVASVASSTHATVHANRYTSPDTLAGLPATDAGAFEVGDVVILTDRSGAVLNSGSTATVEDITGNVLTLSNNFGGALTAGTVVTYADRGEVTEDQHTRFVYWADQTDRTVGASSDKPWRYAEP